MEEKWILTSKYANKINEINKDVLGQLEKMGITYYAHGLKTNGVRSCYFSHDNWGNYMVEKKLYKVDPYSKTAEISNETFLHWNEVPMNQDGAQVCSQRNSMCGIVKGITISLHSMDLHEIIALGTPYELLDTEKLVRNQQYLDAVFNIIASGRDEHFNLIYGIKK